MNTELLKNFFREFDSSEWSESYAKACAELCYEYFIEMGEDGHEASYAKDGFLMGFIWATQQFFDFAAALTSPYTPTQTKDS